MAFRKANMIALADWIQGNAKPRPRKNSYGDDIPPDPSERVDDFE